MGLFWDLIQQVQLHDQDTKRATLEDRVLRLERELRETRAVLQQALQRLETHVQADLDGDGRVG